jgi:hypothetical protein
MPEVVGVILGLVVLVGGLASRASAQPLNARNIRRVPIVVVLVAAVAAGGFALNRYYLDHRYQNVAGMTTIYRWARGVRDARIAIVGTFLQYPLAGKDSSNYVQYVAQRHSNGASTPITRCDEWRRTLNRGKYDYVVVTTNLFPFPSKLAAPQAAWTAQDPSASLVLQQTLPYRPEVGKAQAWLYKINGRLDPGACADQ